jgi:TolB-like protein
MNNKHTNRTNVDLVLTNARVWSSGLLAILTAQLFTSCAIFMDDNPNREIVIPQSSTSTRAKEQRKTPVITAEAWTSHPHKTATAAVLTFDAGAGVTKEEVALLTDRFAIELDRAQVYTLVSRSKTKEILEQKSDTPACSSVECAVKAGKRLDVKYVIYGSVGHIGSMYTVNVHMAEVEKGSEIVVATADFKGKVEELLTDGMRQSATSLLKETSGKGGP